MALVEVGVILAGGRGERAWPLTATRPKPLLPLPGDETVLTRLVRQARRVARHIYVLAPPGRSGLFKQVLGDDAIVVEQDYSKGYGTGAAALSLLDSVSEDGRALILYGDLVIDDEVVRVLERLAGGQYLLAFRTSRNGRRYGVVVEKNGRVERIVEKPGWSGEVLVNAGIYILDLDLLRRALDEIEVSERGELELTDAINVVASRASISVVKVGEGSVIDVGTWWDYLTAARRVLEWLVRSGCKPLKVDGVTGYEAVLCGHEPRVKPPVVVEGPVWLGRGVELGPFTRLRPYSIVLDGAELGAFVEVKTSVVMEGVKAHHHAYIGDSVVGEYSNIAAGTIIANLRHDNATVRSCAGAKIYDTGLRKLGAVIGARVKTGINTSILPGARIGPCTWIAPGSVVKGDVPACSYYRRSGEIRDLEPRTKDIIECCRQVEYGKGVGLCRAATGY